MDLEKLRNKLDRFEFFKKACKFMDEGRWDEAKVYLEALVAFVEICKAGNVRQNAQKEE